MARGDSVTVSFRLNLNREEDMEIVYDTLNLPKKSVGIP